MLRVDAPASEVARLGAALAELADQEPLSFDALFEPLAPHTRVRLQSLDISRMLCWFGLVAEEGGDLVGLHRIRRASGRVYVMELGGAAEYHQDVWPETDAMLAALDEARPGSLCDLGTGCGIVAIEAAARGHRVVATDLFPTALELARFNAALNGLSTAIDFRQGHWCEPIAGERFDLILTAPHYTRVADQLRLEVLRTAPAHVAPGGRLVMATFLEWEGEAGALAAADALLAPLARNGASVSVAPIVSPLKREWFHLARAVEPIAGLVSRHRFLVTISPEGARLEIARPAVTEQISRFHVPLARLTKGAAAVAESLAPAHAVITTKHDLAALRTLLTEVRDGVVHFENGAPVGLLDACRFGARTCVSLTNFDGAAGAILDGNGGIRPCTHGDVIAGVADSMTDVIARQRELAAEAALRRGCAECPANASCSRCLFPTPLTESDYCDLVRAEVTRWPSLHRLFDTIAAARFAGPVIVKLHRCDELVAARSRPLPVERDPASPSDDLVRALADRWRDRETWILRAGDRFALSIVRDGKSKLFPVDDATAELGELIADGATTSELGAYRKTHRERFPNPRTERRVLRALSDLLGNGLDKSMNR